ncbi:MAG: hypothetical protein LBQ94_10035 [Treponema sp.]|nr:hypothetical protein [Treponema sp.]
MFHLSFGQMIPGSIRSIEGEPVTAIAHFNSWVMSSISWQLRGLYEFRGLHGLDSHGHFATSLGLLIY